MRIIAASVSASDAALAGWGTQVDGRLTRGSVTAEHLDADRDPSNGLLEAEWDEEGAGRSARERGDDDDPREPLPEDVSPFSFDMLRRAAATTDGNAFFGDYDRAEADERHRVHGAGSGDSFDDLSLQYGDEARHAACVLKGMNLVVDDLVDAAFLGRSALGLSPDAETVATAGTRGLDALARIAARLLMDCGDAAAAAGRIATFQERLSSLCAGTLAEPGRRIEPVAVGLAPHEREALERYADAEGGDGAWKRQFRTWRDHGHDEMYWGPACRADRATIKALTERIPDAHVRWIDASPAPCGPGDVVHVLAVTPAGRAVLVPDGAGAWRLPSASPGEATTSRACAALLAAGILGEELPDGRLDLAAEFRRDDGSRSVVLVARMRDSWRDEDRPEPVLGTDGGRSFALGAQEGPILKGTDPTSGIMRELEDHPGFRYALSEAVRAGGRYREAGTADRAVLVRLSLREGCEAGEADAALAGTEHLVTFDAGHVPSVRGGDGAALDEDGRLIADALDTFRARVAIEGDVLEVAASVVEQDDVETDYVHHHDG